MKTKPCRRQPLAVQGYAPVVDGKIWGNCFAYTKREAAYNVAKSFGVAEIIKVEIRPVKIPRKKKSAKRIRQQYMKQSKKPRRVVWRTIRGKS